MSFFLFSSLHATFPLILLFVCCSLSFLCPSMLLTCFRTPLLPRSPSSSILTPFILALFFFLLITSLLSLISWSSCISCQLPISLALGSSAVLSTIVIGLFNSWIYNISHLVSSAPLFLGLLLASVEFISLAIRPITLSVRLTSNLTSGHVMLALVRASSTTLLVLFCFIVIELLVAALQSYVFACLTVSYLQSSIW